jgi:hypothetical protein
VDIKAKKDNSFELVLQIQKDGQNFDITGYTGLMEVKERNESDPSILTFDSSNSTMDMGTTNNFEITLSQTEAAMDLTVGKYVYDLVIENTSPAEQLTIMQGVFEITSRITVK